MTGTANEFSWPGYLWIMECMAPITRTRLGIILTDGERHARPVQTAQGTTIVGDVRKWRRSIQTDGFSFLVFQVTVTLASTYRNWYSVERGCPVTWLQTAHAFVKCASVPARW